MSQSAEERAEEAISFAEKTAMLAAEAIGVRMDLEASRALEKDFAIRRLMAEAEGRGEKASYTASEKTTQSDPIYQDHHKTMSDLEVARLRAETDAELQRMQHERLVVMIRMEIAAAEVAA